MSNRWASLLFTGFFDNMESVRETTDSVPYENFPFCCSSNQQVNKRDLDFSKVTI